MTQTSCTSSHVSSNVNLPPMMDHPFFWGGGAGTAILDPQVQVNSGACEQENPAESVHHWMPIHKC
eukprot:2498583-Amphidinium_carterae.1